MTEAGPCGWGLVLAALRGTRWPAAARPWVAVAVGLAAAGAAAGSAGAQPEPPGATQATRLAFTQLDAPGGPYDIEWHLPSRAGADTRPGTWVLLQHGFARRCANLRGAARHLAAQGLVTLCVNAEMAAGAPALAAALAAALLVEGRSALPTPDGVPAVPPRWVLGGHSAGALFAARVGAVLVQAAPHRVVGALLLDPEGGTALADALSRLSGGGQRPVRAVLARPSRCNAQHRALPALMRVQAEARAAGRDARVGVQLTGRSTHVDAEGEDTEAVAVWACREAWPEPLQVQALRQLAGVWALDMAAQVGKAQASAAEATRRAMEAMEAREQADALLAALKAEGRVKVLEGTADLDR